MEAIIIVGAPGIGKSSVLDYVLQKLDRKTALLDGDSVGRIFPRTNDELMDNVRSNIVSCAEQFKAGGAEVFLTTYFFSASQSIIDLMRQDLEQIGCCVHAIALTASAEDLLLRNRKRDPSLSENSAFHEYVCESDRAISALEGASILDTTGITLEEVSQKLASTIKQLTISCRRQPKGRA